jgi:hypothetical protein
VNSAHMSISFWETGLQVGDQLQFKCDLQENTLGNLTPGSKVKLCTTQYGNS